MSRVFWDTNIFIYFFEQRGAPSEQATALRARMLQRGDQLFTSALTLGEILVKPMEAGDPELCDRYETLIARAAVIVPFDPKAARMYAALRRDRTIKAPDAIQLACAATARVDLFITNDQRLRRKHVDGIHFISDLDQAPI
ncbi:MAG TPA: type II toxin-antitoxin system VapC family toxin [Terriglobales bacterium]|nr:type II toxin-antitoxin system VapC family toxin [Terriglobales bacterium]